MIYHIETTLLKFVAIFMVSLKHLSSILYKRKYKMRLLLLLETVASDLINWRIMMNSIKGSYIES